MVYVNKAQRKALKRVWLRGDTGFDSYRQFRATVLPGSGCVMVKWCSMWLGIEPCGYTHS